MADIFHALFIVTLQADGQAETIYYIPSHILRAHPAVYQPRNPLRPTAHRHGFRGFVYNLKGLPEVGIKEVYTREVAGRHA